MSYTRIPALLVGPDATRLVDFARACRGAARAVALYPRGHSTVTDAVQRIVELTSEPVQTAPLLLTVLADDLLVGDRAIARPDAAIGDVAALLHSHRIGRVTIHPGGDADAWYTFFVLLGQSPAEVRAEGGVARMWAEADGRHIELREIDDAGELRARIGDDPSGWNRIVNAVIANGPTPTDAALLLLFDAADGPDELVAAVERASCAPDGPSSKPAVLLHILRRIVDYVSKQEPDRLEIVLRMMAAAIDRMSLDLLIGLLERHDAAPLLSALVGRVTDDTIVAFTAKHAADPQVSTDRLACAFHALTRDPDQRQRLRMLVYDDVSTSLEGATDQFRARWATLADAPEPCADVSYVTADYARQLAGARARALEVEDASDDPPERIDAWLETVSTTALGSLDLALLLDLLRIDHDPARWGTLMTPVVRMLEDFLLVGDFEGAQKLLTVLVTEAADEQSPRRSHAIDAIDILIDTSTVRHITAHLATIDDDQFEVLKVICLSLGEVIVRPLVEALAGESRPETLERLTSILVAFGPVGRRSIERLKTSPHLAIRRTALQLLREIGDPAAVPRPADLLAADPQAQLDALRAIFAIGTEEAYRAIEQALAAAEPPARDALMQAIGSAGHEHATALYAHLVRHVDPRGPLTPVIAQAVESLGALRDPAAIPWLQEVLYKGDWWAPRRTAALRAMAAAALARIGTGDAIAVLDEAAAQGPRGVRAAVRVHVEAVHAHEPPPPDEGRR